MKRMFTYAAALVCGMFMLNSAQAQSCLLVEDSISAGNNATEHRWYNYTGTVLTTIDHMDSNSVQINRVDSVFYNGNGLQSMVKIYNTNPMTLRETSTLTYDGSNRLIRVHVAGDNGNGPWTMAHDIAYNGSGEMESMKMDALSISGDPEGFTANFDNMVWTNGNVTSVDLIIDMGMGVDTIELGVSYDSGNNLSQMQPIYEVGDLIEQVNQNNITQIVTLETEVFGAPGQIALHNTYSYDGNNNVIVRNELPGLFNGNQSTYGYKYTCSGVGIDEFRALEAKIYPTPTSDVVNIQTDESIESVQLFDLNGRLVMTDTPLSSKAQLEVSSLESGMYMIRVESQGAIHQSKVVIE